MRLLIVDDNEGVRRSLRRLVTVEDWDVCGEATDGPEGIQAVRQLKPDLVILDLFMPGMSGIDVAREIRDQFPKMQILLMTEPDPEIEEAAARVGIRGIVSKADGRIVSAIRALLRDGPTDP
jgi:DNA-binding NarL/FixJ family response regulator